MVYCAPYRHPVTAVTVTETQDMGFVVELLWTHCSLLSSRRYAVGLKYRLMSGIRTCGALVLGSPRRRWSRGSDPRTTRNKRSKSRLPAVLMTRYWPAFPQPSASWGDCCLIPTTGIVSALVLTDYCSTTLSFLIDQSLRLSSSASPSPSYSGTRPTHTHYVTRLASRFSPYLNHSHVQSSVVAQLLTHVSRRFGRVIVSTFQSLQLFGSDCGPGSLRRSLCKS